MADTWADLVAKINLSANDLATAINTLMANERLIKGGVASVTPSTTLEALAANVAANVVTDSYEANTSSAVTLVYTDGNKTFNPTADHDINLPKTSVGKGHKRTYSNRSATKVLTVKATNSTPGDGGTVCIILPLGWVTFQARQATPTANTHWMQVDAGGGWFEYTATWDGMTISSQKTYARRVGPTLEMDVAVYASACDGAVSPLVWNFPFSLVSSANYDAYYHIAGIFSWSNAAFVNNVVLIGASKAGFGFKYAVSSNTGYNNRNDNYWANNLPWYATFRANAKIAGWEIG